MKCQAIKKNYWKLIWAQDKYNYWVFCSRKAKHLLFNGYTKTVYTVCEQHNKAESIYVYDDNFNCPGYPAVIYRTRLRELSLAEYNMRKAVE